MPFYLRHLGLEGYGLVGLMSLVVSLLAVFSRGLGSAVQREIGRRSGTAAATTLRQLLRSVEVLYWGLAAGLALLLAAAAFTIGPRWVQAQQLSLETVTTCLVLLAVRVAVAFPHSVYQSVFVGAERQVLGNALNAAIALTSATCGVASVLVFQSVVAVYASEVVVAAVYVFVLRAFAFSVLPAAPAAFDRGEVRALMGISAALVWTNGVGLLLSNLDRLIVSALMPVAALAVYTMAVMGGRLVTLFSNPFLQASFPRMCQVTQNGSPEDQARDVLRNAAVLVVIAASFGLPLAAFAAEVLTFWVRDPALVAATAPIMSIYTAACLLLAFASVFYQWQTATGRVGVQVTFNGIALLWFPLLLWILTQRMGPHRRGNRVGDLRRAGPGVERVGDLRPRPTARHDRVGLSPHDRLRAGAGDPLHGDQPSCSRRLVCALARRTRGVRIGRRIVRRSRGCWRRPAATPSGAAAAAARGARDCP